MKGMRLEPSLQTEELLSPVSRQPASRIGEVSDKGTEDANGKLHVKKTEKNYEFLTKSKVGRVGYVMSTHSRSKRSADKSSLLLVGLGGNNGTTVLATHLANKHNVSWHTKDGLQQPNYIGSLVRASTLRLGTDPETGKDVFVPVSEMLPMVHPNDFVIGGWDISGVSMDKAMARAKVLQYDLQRQLAPMMENITPMPSIYCESTPPPDIPGNLADPRPRLYCRQPG